MMRFLLLCPFAAPMILPSVLPKEYSYSLQQTYKATSITRGVVLNDQSITASQYWSLSSLSSRGLVSSGTGVDKGAATPVLNELTVTNYTDTAGGSLVVDLIGLKCTYYGVEGGASYTGYDFYHNFFKELASANVTVNQYNVSDWIYDGKSYGAVNIFSAIPPTANPAERLLQYTLVFKDGSNQMISYQTNGTEMLPNEQGQMEKVQMAQISIRSNYRILGSADEWPADFFSTSKACYFPHACGLSACTASASSSTRQLTDGSPCVNHNADGTLCTSTQEINQKEDSVKSDRKTATALFATAAVIVGVLVAGAFHGTMVAARKNQSVRTGADSEMVQMTEKQEANEIGQRPEEI